MDRLLECRKRESAGWASYLGLGKSDSNLVDFLVSCNQNVHSWASKKVNKQWKCESYKSRSTVPQGWTA